jgi:RNA polymerase sigma-70 factor (ECF subfamily)
MTAGESNPLSIIRTFSGAALSKAGQLDARVTGLYDAHRDGVYRFLVAQGMPPAVAQEIAQDVFVKLFIALRDGAEITSEQGWLYAVAAKSAVDHWRREGTAVWVELDIAHSLADAFQSEEPSPEALALHADGLRRISHALMNLPKEQRMCVQLRSEGLRYREIAGILGVAVSTASEWLTIAVERLRRAARD